MIQFMPANHSNTNVLSPNYLASKKKIFEDIIILFEFAAKYCIFTILSFE